MRDSTQEDRPIESVHYAAALRDMTVRYERLIRGLSILKQIDQIDHPDLTFEQICLCLIRLLAKGFAAENCSLLLFDPERSELVLCAAASALDEKSSYVGPDLWTGKRFRIGEGIAGQAAASGKIIRCDDVNNEADFVRLPDSPVEIHALMCVPLRIDDSLVGVVNFSHSKPGMFLPESERLMSIVGDRCARLIASQLSQYERRRAEDYYRLVAEKVGDAVLVFDHENRLLNANAVIEQISGIPSHEFITGKRRWEDRIHDEDKESFRKFRECVAQSLTNETLEYRYIDLAGKVHHIEERCSPLAGTDGSFRGYVCIIRDRTEHRKIEQEKRQIEEQLRHAQKMEALGRLAGGMAHDFNNLLTGILGNITLAATINDVSTIRRLLSEAEKAAERAAEVTKQLLMMSRRTPVEKKQVSLDNLLKEIQNILVNTFDPSIEISAFIPPGVWSIYASSDQVHQVLLNLCVNARDALMEKKKSSPYQHLRLDITAENVSVEETFCNTHPEAKPGNYVKISVSDTGTGISSSVKPHIFEPFFTTKDEETGTGLGLSIVYAIMKDHGGWVDFWSAEGQGSTFEVFFPAIAGETSHVTARKYESGGHFHGSETILMVDDEEVILQLGRNTLEPYGYTLLTARDGIEGLNLFEHNLDKVDAVILDLLMPKLSGVETLQRIRDMKPDAKILVSTGNTAEPFPQLVGKYAPSAYLKKPYSHGELLKTLRTVLDTVTR